MNKAFEFVYEATFWITAIALVFGITLNAYLTLSGAFRGFPPMATPAVVTTLDCVALAVLVILYKRGRNG